MNKQIRKSNCNTCMHYSVCMKCRDPFTYDIIPSVGCNSHTKLVRCKDCKHYDEYFRKCYVFCHDNIGVELEVDSDHFCSYGERRSENEHT